MAVHALVTGPITGTVPIDHKKYPDGEVDVTPDVLQFTSKAEMLAVAEAIGDAHKTRRTGPYAPPEEA